MQNGIIFLDSVDSTNEYVKKNMTKLNDGAIVVAGNQTAGRGRFARKWNSDISGNLYCSVVLKDLSWITAVTQLPVFIAVVVRRLALAVLGDYKADIGFKWPNDLYAGGKLAGILIETESGCYIVGIGLNIAGAPYLNEIKASSIASINPALALPTQDSVAEQLSNILDAAIFEYSESGFAPFKSEWEDACIHLNRDVVLNENVGDDMKDGKTVFFMGINNDGSARVKGPDGDKESAVYYGELKIHD